MLKRKKSCSGPVSVVFSLFSPFSPDFFFSLVIVQVSFCTSLYVRTSSLPKDLGPPFKS